MIDCEKAAEHSSAWLDGELPDRDRAALEAHLDACAACRAQRKRFEAVDTLVRQGRIRQGSVQPGSVQPGSVQPGSVQPGRRLETRISASLGLGRGRRTLGRLLSVAAAALVIIALSLVILVTGDNAAANRAARSMAMLDIMNEEAAEEQAAMLDTMQWQLEALKMEVDYSELDEGKSGPILQRIESLLQEVEKVRRGESKE